MGPRFVGIDGDHEVLTWIPGSVVDDWSPRPDLLDQLVAAVRQLHDATADLAPGHECLIHDDLQPRNVVVDGTRVGVVDWEQLRPGRRVEDVAQLCWSFAAGPADREVLAVGDRWRRIVDRYGLAERNEVVAVASAKIDRCVDDIVRGSALGSARHHRLRARGDHEDLRRLGSWIDANRHDLSALLA
ncbi:MAG: phosphotransferase [Actinomycetota bacterium]